MAWPHMPRLLNNFNLSVTFFASFVAFALVPLFHWVSVVGGLRSEQVSLHTAIFPVSCPVHHQTSLVLSGRAM